MDYRIASNVTSGVDNYNDLSGLQSLKQEASQDEALKKVAKQFESLFLHELLKNMRNANKAFEEGGLFNNSESKMFRDMYDQQISLEMASGKGTGLADVLYQQLSQQYPSSKDHAAPPGQGFLLAEPGLPLAPVKSLPKADFLAAKEYGKGLAPALAKATDKVTNVKTDTAAVTEIGAQTDIGKAGSQGFTLPQEFVAALLPVAKKAARALGLNPLMMLAQAALETGWGKHVLEDSQGGSSFNLFNIKADSNWGGERVNKNTVEYHQGIAVKEQANFRKYASFEHSFQDFVEFLQNNPRYEQALSQSADAKNFIQGIHQAGYATDPNYSDKVLAVYQRVVEYADAQAESK